MLLWWHESFSDLQGVGPVTNVELEIIDNQEGEANKHYGSYDPAESWASLEVYEATILFHLLLSVLIELLLEELFGL